jgi:hypothetical protein
MDACMKQEMHTPFWSQIYDRRQLHDSCRIRWENNIKADHKKDSEDANWMELTE